MLACFLFFWLSWSKITCFVLFPCCSLLLYDSSLVLVKMNTLVLVGQCPLLCNVRNMFGNELSPVLLKKKEKKERKKYLRLDMLMICFLLQNLFNYLFFPLAMDWYNFSFVVKNKWMGSIVLILIFNYSNNWLCYAKFSII